jgi:hypothetical protein
VAVGGASKQNSSDKEEAEPAYRSWHDGASSPWGTPL